MQSDQKSEVKLSDKILVPLPGLRSLGRGPAAWRTSRGAAGSQSGVEAVAVVGGGKLGSAVADDWMTDWTTWRRSWCCLRDGYCWTCPTSG